ncbi:MAG: CerR family C-terminal domain-containing protein [Thermoguttaceae bacterium]|nr:CerR family C-terminal domain-containing protein [Thermoguttaceae bacterium]
MRVRSDGAETRRRILDAAGSVFARRGFRDATMAEIAREAQVNPALINYHFTDKETLYRQAWQRAWERTRRRYRLGDTPPGKTAARRLVWLIGAMVRAAADRRAADQEIWRKELAQPTELLAVIRQTVVVPLRRAVGSQVREILGPEADDQAVRLATMSIISQCRTPICGDTGQRPFVDVDLARRIEHIRRFSLGGLRAMRRKSASAAGER